MTFEQIVDDVMDELNLTSNDARTRVGRKVNDRYRQVTSAIGLDTSRRLEFDVDVAAGEPSLPDIYIPNVEKVLAITREYEDGSVKILPEVTFQELSTRTVHNTNPTLWAVKRMGPGQVLIRVDGHPADEAFTLHIEGYEIAPILADDTEPYFPSDFHDILYHGAIADECMKMEKPQLAQISEAKYNNRLSDLRMFIAKSSFKDIFQSKTRPSQLGYRPWATRITVFN